MLFHAWPGDLDREIVHDEAWQFILTKWMIFPMQKIVWNDNLNVLQNRGKSGSFVQRFIISSSMCTTNTNSYRCKPYWNQDCHSHFSMITLRTLGNFFDSPNGASNYDEFQRGIKWRWGVSVTVFSTLTRSTKPSSTPHLFACQPCPLRPL